MRILHLISQKPGGTGSGIYLKSLIREGEKRSYDQALIAGINKEDLDDFQGLEGILYKAVVFMGGDLDFKLPGMSDVMPYPTSRFKDLKPEEVEDYKEKFLNKIDKLVEEFKPNLIISHHLFLMTSLVAGRYGIKTIGICHGTDIRQIRSSSLDFDFTSNLRKLDLVLSLSSVQKREIHKLYGINLDKIKVIGGGYPSDIFNLEGLSRHKTDPIRLIYGGKLSYSKGLMSLLSVFKSLPEEGLELVIAGRGTGGEEKDIISYGKSIKGVKFLGELSQEDLGKEFKKSHIFVMPSYYEGLSLVTIEALATGLLTVATEIPGLINFLGYEINNSGLIEYVKLPPMEAVDRPREEGLDDFHRRFKDKILLQVSRVREGIHYRDLVESQMKAHSWHEIYNNIEKLLK